jgi:putative tricarboxylic transport membrane protein
VRTNALTKFWRALNKSELIAAGLLIALGVAIVLQARHWVYLTPDGPGPGFFPLWAGMAIVALAMVVMSGHLIAVLRKQAVARVDWTGAPRVLLSWSGLAASIALLKPAGFVVSFLLLVLFLVTVIYRRSILAALSVGIGSTAGFWILFVELLDVRLPAGPWGF